MIVYDDAMVPQSVGDLQRNISDAFASAQVTLEQEHHPDGSHKHITVESISQRTAAELIMYAALRFYGGPWLFEQDITGGTIGNGAVCRAAQITANQNDYAPEGIANAIILEIESDAPRTITGIALGTRARRFLWIVNRGNNAITLSHNSASSAVGNRFAISSGADFTLRSGGFIQSYYETGTDVLRIEGT